jgi:urate oxidase
MPNELTFDSYGKCAVRLTKVVRRGDVHDLYEVDAAVQLEGDFAAAYRDGDNRAVVATDTIKNTVYVLAKEWSFTSVEGFAIVLAEHFAQAYPQVTRATVELTQAAWQRVAVDGSRHPHAFTLAGTQQRYAKAVETRGNAGPTPLTGGLRDLRVLKTTGSEWRDFHADRYRTLKDTSDRILATRIDADWTFAGKGDEFDTYHAAIVDAILRTFATRHSLGVQQTILHMGDAALAACPAIDSISFQLPNLHRIPFNLDPFGLKFENDIFVATDEPYGLIRGTVTRGS